jgi:serine carboxypeptidase-like clade 1
VTRGLVAARAWLAPTPRHRRVLPCARRRVVLTARSLPFLPNATNTRPPPPKTVTSQADRIDSLPGYPHDLPSRHYSGYVRVGDGDEDGEAEGGGGGAAAASPDNGHPHPHHRPSSSTQPPARNLFYYLVESERDPANDPVVLWLNGGPGCSSFDAFVYEHGPFLFSAATPSGVSNGGLPALSDNPYAWSKVATMIYLDSPANVGLSFVDPDVVATSTGELVAASPNDAYRTNDTQTASDADAFLRGFFRRHPRLLARPFFITGESYAGIYVPNLARQVVRNNAAGRRPAINLRGYAVGNGCTDAEFDGDALPPFLAGRGLLPLDEFARLRDVCNGSYWDAEGFEWAAAAAATKKKRAGARVGGGSDDGGGGGGGSDDGGAPAVESRAAACGRALERAARVLDGVNIYDVLDLCHASERPRGVDEGEGEVAGGRRRQQRQQQHQQQALRSKLPAAWARVAGLSLPPGRFDVAPGARVAALKPPPPGARAAGAAAAAAEPPSPPSSAPAAPPPPPPSVSHNPPCTSATLAEDWLNNPAVRRALHAAPISPDGGGGGGGQTAWWAAGPWMLCSDRIHYTHDAGSMLPVHAELLPGLPGWPEMLARAGLREEAEEAGARRARAVAVAAAAKAQAGAADASGPLRALIYTGDHDAAVPSTGSEAWTTAIGGGQALPGREWRAWTVRRGTDGGGRPAEGEDRAAGLDQVGGYTREFPGGLTYATVRGAGHMVPTSKPLEALELFRRFLDGEELAPAAAAVQAEEEGEGEGVEEEDDPLDGRGDGGAGRARPAAPSPSFTVRL